jgi:hypothetical protein
LSAESDDCLALPLGATLWGGVRCAPTAPSVIAF